VLWLVMQVGRVRLERSVVEVVDSRGGVEGEYPFTPVGAVAQEIMVAGGLEGWVWGGRKGCKG
jgi:hypothetical protein